MHARRWVVLVLCLAFLALGLSRAVRRTTTVGPEWRTAAFSRTLAERSFALGPLLPAWKIASEHVPPDGMVCFLRLNATFGETTVARLGVLLYPRLVRDFERIPNPADQAAFLKAKQPSGGVYFVELETTRLPEPLADATLVAQDGSTRLWKLGDGR